MALYLGGDKVKINLNGTVYCLNLFSAMPYPRDVVLLSSDNFILRDLNGLYLIPSDYTEPSVQGIVLLSSDNLVLTDLNGLYLIPKEDE